MNVFAKSLCLTPALFALITMTAHAQFAQNSNAPTDATADSIVNSTGMTVLRGQVDVRQGETRILADEMRIYSASTGVAGSTGQISKIEATGNFYYLTPDQEVRGTDGLYIKSDNTFTVTGDVILLQGDNVVTGSKLIYNLDTEEARVVGTCEGRRCGSNGRVNILIKNTPQNGSTQ